MNWEDWIIGTMVLLFMSILVGCGSAQAATTSACYNITDSDARSYCIARARGDVGQCYNIQRADLRSMCLAEVRK